MRRGQKYQQKKEEYAINILLYLICLLLSTYTLNLSSIEKSRFIEIFQEVGTMKCMQENWKNNNEVKVFRSINFQFHLESLIIILFFMEELIILIIYM